MNRQEYLLTCLAEECAEVQHSVAKALRFGLEDTNPKTNNTNKRQIIQESIELYAILKLCRDSDILADEEMDDQFDEIVKEKLKQTKVWLEYSEKRGCLK